MDSDRIPKTDSDRIPKTNSDKIDNNIDK